MRNHKFLIAMALVAVMSLTLALAGEMLGGLVDWDGNVTPDYTLLMPAPTPMPMPDPSTPSAPSNQVNRGELLTQFEHQYLERDGVMVYCYDLVEDDDHPTSSKRMTRNVFDDMDAFLALIEEADYLTLPQSIPEGYVFRQGTVFYGCREGGEYRLVETIESEHDFRADVYTLDEEDTIITGYNLCFYKEVAGELQYTDYVYVNAKLENITVNDAGFYLNPDETFYTVTVPGMVKSLVIEDETHTSLNMYHDLAEPITLLHSMFTLDTVYHQVHYDLFGTVPAAEQMAMFGGK